MFAGWSVAQTVPHWFDIISQLLPTHNCSSVNNADSLFQVLDSCSAVGGEQFWLVTDSLSPDGSGAGVSSKPRSMWCHKEQSRGMRMSTRSPIVWRVKKPCDSCILWSKVFRGVGYTIESHPGLLNPKMLFIERTDCKALIKPSCHVSTEQIHGSLPGELRPRASTHPLPLLPWLICGWKTILLALILE